MSGVCFDNAKKKNLCVRVARWALELEDYSYKIEHRPGKNMPHVDALSRNPLSEVFLIDESDDGLIAKFMKAQNTDQDIQRIIELVAQNKIDNYEIRNNLLYRSVNNELLLVVPKALESSVVRQAHEQGHFGINKTETRI